MNDKFRYDNIDCDPADCTKSYYTDVTENPDVPDIEAADDAELLSWHSDKRGYTNLDGAYGDDGDEDTEAATEYVDLPDGYEEYAPDDETAATSDELYTTTCAEQRCALDDYEIISDVLGSEKQLVKLYSTALCEAAEEPLRNVIKENLAECAEDQYKTFEFMREHDMYPTEQADEHEILKTKQKFPPLCRNCDVNK